MRFQTQKWVALSVTLLIIVFFYFVGLPCQYAVAGDKCGNRTNTCNCGCTNPYPCCDDNCNGKVDDGCDGNCTWWAWEMACCNWGVALGYTKNNSCDTWGDASNWDNAASKQLYVNAVPAAGVIGVSEANHVAYVQSVDTQNITVSEMNCFCATSSCKNPKCSGSANGNDSVRQFLYTSSLFGHYIYPPLIRATGQFTSASGNDYGTEAVFFVQNRIYYHIINPNILTIMGTLPLWSGIVERPASVVKTTFEANLGEGHEFIARRSRSQGIMIRPIGTPEVLRVDKNGNLQAVSENECKQQNCWANVIDVPQGIIALFRTNVQGPQNIRIIKTVN